MRSSKAIENELAPALEALGLFCFGWFVMADEPFTGHKAVLIGNRAEGGTHGMWKVFQASAEFVDCSPNSLDRWSSGVIGPIAAEHGATALYPFGERLWPFQRYAKQATGMRSSPLGLLIHPDYGLWQAFRSVLVFGEDITLEARSGLAHPCDTCVEKPCLDACPVGAFSENGFTVADCRRHLKSGDDPDCMALGCRARDACPVGISYEQAQIRFHMKAFGKAGE
jgi:hypothetical protein